MKFKNLHNDLTAYESVAKMNVEQVLELMQELCSDIRNEAHIEIYQCPVEDVSKLMTKLIWLCDRVNLIYQHNQQEICENSRADRLEEKREKLTNIQSQLKELELRDSTLKSECEEAKNQLGVRQKEIDALNAEKEKLIDSLKKQELEIDTIKDTILQMQKKLDDSQATVAEMRESYEKLSEKWKQANQELEAQRLCNEQQEQELDSTLKSKVEFELQIEDRKKEYNTFLSQKVDYQTKLENWKSQISAVQNSIKVAKSMCEEKEADYKKLQLYQSKLDEETKKWNEQINYLADQWEIQKKDNKALCEVDIPQLKQANELLAEKKQTLIEEKQALQREKQTIQKELIEWHQKIEDETKKKSEQEEQLAKAKVDYETLQEKSASIDDSCRMLKDKIKRLKSDVECKNAAGMKEELARVLEELLAEQTRLDGMTVDLAKKKDEREKCQMKIQSAQEKLKTVNSEFQQYSEEYNQIQEQLTALERQLAPLKEPEYKRNLEKMKNRLNMLQNIRRELAEDSRLFQIQNDSIEAFDVEEAVKNQLVETEHLLWNMQEKIIKYVKVFK
ncbi:MAG: hypothetical protein ACI4C1_07775 [Lachnospiraceae bacterium]